MKFKVRLRTKANEEEQLKIINYLIEKGFPPLTKKEQKQLLKRIRGGKR